jgi:hypothetical protein
MCKKKDDPCPCTLETYTYNNLGQVDKKVVEEVKCPANKHTGSDFTYYSSGNIKTILFKPCD